MSAASAFGAWVTQVRPTSRGRTCFVSFLSGGRARTRRTAPEQGPSACGVFGGRETGENGRCFPKRDSQGSGPLSGCGQSRQCRRPVPLARIRRTPAPRAGGGLASFRFCPAAERVHGRRPTSRGRPPAAFWGDGRRGENGRCFPKRDSQGSGPLSGCGQSPQCRRPVPLARIRRTSAPRAGGGLASFRFCPAAERIHGGRPTSRGRPPAAFWGTGDGGKRTLLPKKGFSRVWTLERVRAEPAGLPAGWWGG